jgi:hypothetical protein
MQLLKHVLPRLATPRNPSAVCDHTCIPSDLLTYLVVHHSITQSITTDLGCTWMIEWRPIAHIPEEAPIHSSTWAPMAHTRAAVCMDVCASTHTHTYIHTHVRTLLPSSPTQVLHTRSATPHHTSLMCTSSHTTSTIHEVLLDSIKVGVVDVVSARGTVHMLLLNIIEKHVCPIACVLPHMCRR